MAASRVYEPRRTADGLFPRVLGRVSPRGTPVVAMVAAGVLASMLVAMNYSRGLVELFTFITLLATLSTLVPNVFCSLAVWLMPGRPRPAGALAVVSILAFLYAMYAIAGAGADTVFYGFLWRLLQPGRQGAWPRRCRTGCPSSLTSRTS